MPTFTVTGDIDPFLQVQLAQGEQIYCESNAMVMMTPTLDLRGKMKGGIGGALMRSLANGESFFQQTIEAVRGDGGCMLSPTLPGSIKVIDVGVKQYLLNDGAFVAATSGVEMQVRRQNLGNALFAQSGGLFIAETAGMGQVAVSGFGAMSEVEVKPGQDLIIDNSHAVCWDSALQYEVAVTTNGGKSSGLSGMFGKMLNSVTSGEGVVLRFSGSGKVYLCSRNRASFLAWVAGAVGSSE